jgi:hypothetical protein
MTNELIVEEKLQEMLAVAQAMEKRLGIVLIERGYISRDDLARTLLYQFREVINKTLTLSDAEFSYADGLDGYVEDVRCELDPIRLLDEARKWQDFRALIPNDQVIFQIKPDAPASKSMHAARELRVLLLLDGKRRVDQIIRKTGYSRLAVYRSLAKLYSQNAIVRQDSVKSPASEVDKLDASPIIGLYQELLQLIIDDIAEELGKNKATVSFGSSMQQSTYYEEFLKVFRPEQDVAWNVGQIQAHFRKRGKTISGRDLIKGFNQVIAGLLREQYRFLGPKGTKNTVQKLRVKLDRVPSHQGALARSMSKLLGQYVDKGFLNGARKPSSAAEVDNTRKKKAAAPSLGLEKLGGNSIVTFFNEMYLVVLSELEQEVGAKAREIFQKILKQSKYYDPFFSQFDLQSTLGSSPLSRPEHLRDQKINLDKGDMVRAFLEVLVGLLNEEVQFLGAKATNVTVSRLVKRMAGTNTQLKPLANYLSASLGRIASQLKGKV